MGGGKGGRIEEENRESEHDEQESTPFFPKILRLAVRRRHSGRFFKRMAAAASDTMAAALLRQWPHYSGAAHPPTLHNPLPLPPAAR